MQRTLILCALALWAVLAGACSVLAEDRAAPEATLDDVSNGLVAADPAVAGAFFQDGADGDVRARSENAFGKAAAAPPATPEPAADRRMVYTAQLGIEVARVDDAIARLSGQAQVWGGYVSSRHDAVLVLRVPAAKFEQALAAVREYGRVLSESLQAQDVTREHMDLSIRLETARKARERLLVLLEKAEKVEDMLKIEEQLRRVTEEIERMTGELKFLDDRVAMSTLTVEFRGVAAPASVQRRRTPSRFRWLNDIGLENLRRQF